MEIDNSCEEYPQLLNQDTTAGCAQNTSSLSPGSALDFARQIVATAKKKAAEIIETSEQVIKTKTEAAIKTALAVNQETLCQHLLDIEKERFNIISDTKAQSIKLVIAITEEILGKTSQVDPQYLKHRLDKGFDAIANQSEVRLILHPSDQKLASEYLKSFNKLLTHKTIEVLPDESLTPGSAKFVCRDIVVISDIQHHLNRIKTRILTNFRTQNTQLPEDI